MLCPSPSLCETRLKCQLLTAASLPSVAGNGDTSCHTSRRPADAGRTRLTVPTWLLVSDLWGDLGLTYPTRRARLWGVLAVWGEGGGAALAAGSTGAVGRGRAHLSTRPPRGAGAERPLHGSWRGGLARTPGLTRDASGESGARAGSRGSAPAPRQTSLLPPRGEDGAPARPVPGSEGERGTLSQSRLLDDKTRSRVRVLVTGRDKGAPRRGCSVPRVRLRLKGALSFGALCHRRGSTATG